MRKSLAETYPELLKEWDFEDNVEDPYIIGPKSTKKVWWICSRNPKHKWQAQIRSRTKLGSGCRFCAGLEALLEDSFGAKRPDLLKEWSPENKENPFEIVLGSTKNVLWVCSKNPKHKWKMGIRQRTIYDQGCKYCAGRDVLSEESLGALKNDLLEEWDHSKNDRDPFTLTLGSGYMAWWKCKNGHSWKASVYSRVYGSGCSSCSGHKTPPEKSLGILFPELVEELIDNIDVFSTSPNSHKIVNWQCKVDKRHIWPAEIRSRKNGAGCSYCHKLRVLPEESFVAKHSELLEKWDYSLNKEDPCSLGEGSGKKVWWLCPNGHSYQSTIRYMVSASPSCNICNPKGSRTGNGWLDKIGIKCENREKNINIDGKLYYVDGLELETKTVFEYMGDFWHGNPEIYDPNRKHPIIDKTFGQLYEETMHKIDILVRAGYRVFCKWGP